MCGRVCVVKFGEDSRKIGLLYLLICRYLLLFFIYLVSVLSSSFFFLSPQVARLQMVVLDALRQLGTSEAAAAVSMLNAELMDISKLYGDFAEPFRLADCKLAIVHCAGHDDPTLVESLWREIIENGRGTRAVSGALCSR